MKQGLKGHLLSALWMASKVGKCTRIRDMRSATGSSAVLPSYFLCRL